MKLQELETLAGKYFREKSFQIWRDNNLNKNKFNSTQRFKLCNEGMVRIHSWMLTFTPCSQKKKQLQNINWY